MEVSNHPVRNRRSKQQILDLLSVFENSNLTVQEFCSTHNINAGNFHKWTSRYKRNTGTEKFIAGGFAAMNIVASHSGLFAEVNGIRIYQPVSASFLKELAG
jgi:hypothetical protein